MHVCWARTVHLSWAHAWKGIKGMKNKTLPALLTLTNKKSAGSLLKEYPTCTPETFWQCDVAPQLEGYSTLIICSDTQFTANLLRAIPIPKVFVYTKRALSRVAPFLEYFMDASVPVSEASVCYDASDYGNLPEILEACSEQGLFPVLFLPGTDIHTDTFRECSCPYSGILIIAENMIFDTRDSETRRYLFSSDNLFIAKPAASDLPVISSVLPKIKVSQPTSSLGLNYFGHGPQQTALINHTLQSKPKKLGLSMAQTNTLVDKPLLDEGELMEHSLSDETIVLRMRDKKFGIIPIRSKGGFGSWLHGVFDKAAKMERHKLTSHRE